MTTDGVMTSNTSCTPSTSRHYCTPEIQLKVGHNLGTFFTVKALCDSGAEISVLPYNLLPPFLHRQVKPTVHTLTGIGGDASLKGEITLSTHLDKYSTPAKCKFLVTTSGASALLGQNFLSAYQCWFLDTNDNYVYFKTADQTVKVPNVNDKYVTAIAVTAGPTNPVDPGVTIATDVTTSATSSSKPLPTAPVSAKIQWLKKQKQVNFPSTLTSEQTNQLAHVLYKHSNVIAAEDHVVGTFNREVPIPTTTEIKAKPQFPLPQATLPAFRKEIAKMEKMGVIERCKDPQGWNSPIFCVPKRDKTIRLVVDFKNTLNPCLKALDPYPFADIESVFKNIPPNMNYFATLDLKKGYHQLRILEKDRHKTAFTFEGKTYQYCRLPLGITTAGNIFCRAVGEVLDTLPDRTNLVNYIDDNCIFGHTFDDFLSSLDNFLGALGRFGLVCNPAKCEFAKPSVKFLGRIVSGKGYSADPDYLQGIRDMKPPTSRKELQRVIGALVWIRAFIETRQKEPIRAQNFAKLCAPLHALNKANIAFNWSKDADRAFNNIKKRLCTSPVISFADYNEPFIVACDASNEAAGYAVLQVQNGKEVIIATGSRTFHESEKNWSTLEKEAFSLLNAVSKNHHFLYGRTFIVQTDHCSLVYLDRKLFNNSKLRRWQAELSQYDFCVQYVPGKENILADLFSRPNGTCTSAKPTEDERPAGQFLKVNDKLVIYVPSWCTLQSPIQASKLPPPMKANMAQVLYSTSTTVQLEPIVNKSMLAATQYKDPYLATIIDALVHTKAGHDIDIDAVFDVGDHRTTLYRHKWSNLQLEEGTHVLLLNEDGIQRPIIPYELRLPMLQQAHENMNHSGRDRMMDHLKSVTWENKAADIDNYVKSCIMCAKRKGRYGQKPDFPVGHVKRGSKPFEVIYLDFVHMHNSKGKYYILTILDSFSRFFICIPTARDRSIDAARGLYQVFLDHRVIPEIVSTDRGTHFTGETFRQFCNLMNIKPELHCPWRPQSSGNIERQHRTLKNALYILQNELNVEWTDILQSVVSNMNCCKNKSTGFSPHFLITGRKPSLALPMFTPPTTLHTSPSSYATSTRSKLEAAAKAVKLANNEADLYVEKRLQGMYTRPLEAGDQILLYRPVSAVGQSTKLHWIGPFSVIRTNGMVVEIDIDGQTQWVHRAQVRKLVQRDEHLMPLPPPPYPLNTTAHLPPPLPATRPISPSYLPSHPVSSKPQVQKAPTAPPPPQVQPLLPVSTIPSPVVTRGQDTRPVTRSTVASKIPKLQSKLPSTSHLSTESEHTSLGRPKRSNAGVPAKRLIDAMDPKKKSYSAKTTKTTTTSTTVDEEDEEVWLLPPPVLRNSQLQSVLQLSKSFLIKPEMKVIETNEKSSLGSDQSFTLYSASGGRSGVGSSKDACITQIPAGTDVSPTDQANAAPSVPDASVLDQRHVTSTENVKMEYKSDVESVESDKSSVVQNEGRSNSSDEVDYVSAAETSFDFNNDNDQSSHNMATRKLHYYTNHESSILPNGVPGSIIICHDHQGKPLAYPEGQTINKDTIKKWLTSSHILNSVQASRMDEIQFKVFCKALKIEMKFSDFAANRKAVIKNITIPKMYIRGYVSVEKDDPVITFGETYSSMDTLYHELKKHRQFSNNDKLYTLENLHQKLLLTLAIKYRIPITWDLLIDRNKLIKQMLATAQQSDRTCQKKLHDNIYIH